MNKTDLFDLFFDGFAHAWRHQLWQGILFVLFGILILVVPQLLAAMVAGVLILTGVVLMTSAWSLQRLRRQYNGFRQEFFMDL